MIINAKTKRGQDWINRTNHREGYSLDDVYTSASHAKHQAYRWCLEQYRKDEHAENFRNTGEVLPCRHIETAAHTYDVVG